MSVDCDATDFGFNGGLVEDVSAFAKKNETHTAFAVFQVVRHKRLHYGTKRCDV